MIKTTLKVTFRRNWFHTDTQNKPVAGNAALDISNLSNASSGEYQIVEGLADGNACYIDRSYTYSNVPDFLQGAVYIKTANIDKRNMADPLLSFDVNNGRNRICGFR